MRPRIPFWLAFLGAGLLAGGPGLAHAQLSQGTVKLLSKSGSDIEEASGDAFIQISSDEPAKFLIVGPVKIQADFRVNLAPGQARGKPVALEVLGAGKLLGRFKVIPVAGKSPWKDRTDVAPSRPVGFYLDIDDGPRAYEIRVSGADKGAGLFLIPESKARRPLSARAPVVPSKPPQAARPSPTPTPEDDTAVATGPDPAPVSRKTLDDLGTAGGRRADAAMDRFSYEVAAKAGVMAPGDSAYAPGAAAGVEFRWSPGDGRAFGVGFEVTAMRFGGLSTDDPRRALPEYALNVTLVPVALHATWWVPMEGRLRPYVAAGPGMIYAQSGYVEAARSVPETAIGAGGQALAGVQFDLAATDLREGNRKIFLEVKSAYYLLDFAAHEHDSWSSFGALAGVELKF